MTGPAAAGRAGKAIADEYLRFYRTAHEKGLIIGPDFKDNHILMAVFRGGALVKAADALAGATSSAIVTAVSTDSISDDKFEIPAGWTIKTR